MRAASFPVRKQTLCLQGTGVEGDGQLLPRRWTGDSWLLTVPCESLGAPHAIVKTAVLPKWGSFLCSYWMVRSEHSSAADSSPALSQSFPVRVSAESVLDFYFLKEDETRAHMVGPH